MLTLDRNETLIERLDRHPVLRSRVENLLRVVEDAEGDCEKADAAERQMIEELRQMGHEALTAWAKRGGREANNISPSGAGLVAGG